MLDVKADNGVSLPTRSKRLQQILFGWKPDWEPLLRARLDQNAYVATFAQLDGPDLAAFDCVVPLTLADYRAMAANPTRASAAALCPSPETVALCDDKGSFNDFLLHNGFAALVPRLYAPNETADYPIVVKPRHGAWGQGVRILHSPADEERLPNASGWLRQAYVPGQAERVAHILAVDGEIRFWSGLDCTAGKEFTINGQGQPVRYSPANDAAAVAHLSAILRQLRYTGTACFDYKWVDDRPMIFELNPRIGYSLIRDINGYLAATLGVLSGS